MSNLALSDCNAVNAGAGLREKKSEACRGASSAPAKQVGRIVPNS
jgi:hypothetical protein